jgi:hypothetical protein
MKKQYEVSRQEGHFALYVRAENEQEAKQMFVDNHNKSSQNQISLDNVGHCVVSDKVALETVAPQYIRQPQRGHDVPIEYLKSNLDQIREYGELILEPDFQRGRVWTEEQQVKYVEHLLRGGRTGREIYFNRRDGWDNAKNKAYPTELVDGLQRLTAVLKFLDGNLKVFGDYTVNSFQRLNVDLVFFTNNLKTRAEVLESYLQFNGGGTPHTKEELERVKKLLENENGK